MSNILIASVSQSRSQTGLIITSIPNPVIVVPSEAFGGGLHLCPGRHFAINEISSLATLLILRFDIVPAGDGKWPVIRVDSLSSKGSAIIMPENDLDVILCPGENKKWAICEALARSSIWCLAVEMRHPYRKPGSRAPHI